ncbi:hypothetical protein DFA_00022 [Cavenderia fasciculata]|uniref:SH3 domain-containing protein n=1 Tax=Cavenderia fasciculata TaxID=261658 RepID=F4PXD5_CACFS|nr:uncharacterized protein DFA_00022 [Cavenderia fasciculata]EGG19445.1 hypothetical protein DFA_00022 [Cavenderia fasciculata]|eukprot:XP_004357739.1 hypothetical protein DFA_00022 [Cavenderia fasciculata]
MMDNEQYDEQYDEQGGGEEIDGDYDNNNNNDDDQYDYTTSSTDQQQQQQQQQYYDQQGEYDYNAFEPMWVRALYDYDAANDSEISFKENDVVCITQDYEDGWWCGDLNGLVGRVPANYFEYLDQEQNQDYSNFSSSDTYDTNNNNNYTSNDQQYQQQQQHDHQQDYQQDYQGGDDDDEDGVGGGAGDAQRKEMLRQKREMFKKEMKELQDRLKDQESLKDKLADEIERLEKEKKVAEEKARVIKMLRFINLTAIKTETDLNLNAEVTNHARQTGIAVTQDLRALRTALASIKSQAAIDPPKKQFDQRLEELEKKITANLTNLDACDGLKKITLTDVTLFQSEFETSFLKDTALELPLPPPQNSMGGGLAPSVYNLPPPPGSSVSTPTTGLAPPSLSDKDKRKSIKDAKKLEKMEIKEKEKEKKELKKLEKAEAKTKTKEDENTGLWKPSKINK